MKNFSKFVWKIFKALITLVLTLAALAVLESVFLTQIRVWLAGEGFMGNDTGHFIHYVAYYLKHPHFPINAWDHFWHNGVPRAIDLTWIHFILSSLLAKTIGIFAAVKIYPAVALGLGAIFVYLVFYELSRSILIALGLSISFVIGQGYYIGLYTGGVVLSSISQMFLPLQLYFLARFAKRGGYRNLLLGSLSSTLGFGTHGLMMMFFGFIPAFVFVLFTNRESDSLISKKTLLNAIFFATSTLLLSAIFVWPNLLLFLQRGSTTTFWQHLGYDPGNIEAMFRLNDSGVAYGCVAAILLALVFWLFKRKPDKVVRPVLVLLLVYFAWMVSYTVGGNRLFEVLFPGRIFWIWPLSLGALTSVLLSPLSDYRAKNLTRGIIKFFSFGIIKLAVFGIIIFSPLMFFNFLSLQDVKTYVNRFTLPKIEDVDITQETRVGMKDIIEQVDVNDASVRFWTHDQVTNLSWIHVSDMPLCEGYAHIWTYYSRLWEGWFYGVMSAPNWESGEIPREMAKQQSLFFLDWYGVKYLAGDKSIGGEWGIAGHFFENPPYIIKSHEITEGGKNVLMVSPDYTSPLVTAVKTPVLGFVGDDEAYMTFLKDLAMLNLNTSYLIPVKVSEKIGGISNKDLSFLDALVIYDFKKGGLSYGGGWRKIADFVRKGGRVWVEGGGNSGERESTRPPEIFPVTQTKYGPLDRKWQPGGELAGKIDFSSLEELAYRETPWQVSYAPREAVKSGTRVLLTQKDYPVAVLKDIGKGKVLWTGVNFWYRPEEYRQNGVNEIIFIKLFLEELFDDLSPKRVDSRVERSVPEHIVVTGRGFSGVVLKENHWAGWQAKVEVGGKKKKVPIFTAGPELMYIPVPKDLRSGEIRVLVDYKGEPFYWFCTFVSIVSFMSMVIFFIFGDLFLKRFKFSVKTGGDFRKIKTKVSSWWDSEEH